MTTHGREIDQREIYWTKVYFPDKSDEFKDRPVLIVSNMKLSAMTEYILYCPITKGSEGNPFIERISDSDMESGRLDPRSKVRTDVIKLDLQSKMRKKEGVLNKKKTHIILKKVLEFIVDDELKKLLSE